VINKMIGMETQQVMNGKGVSKELLLAEMILQKTDKLILLTKNLLEVENGLEWKDSKNS